MQPRLLRRGFVFWESHPGTRVNNHVARFAVWGKHADTITAPHPWDYAFGLDRFFNLNGKILLLGSDHDAAPSSTTPSTLLTFPTNASRDSKFPSKRTASGLAKHGGIR